MNVLMPESATLLKWHKSEGDTVHRGDLLLEIETDKTVLEVVADADGVLRHILVQENTAAVPAQQLLAVITTAQEVAAAAAPALGAKATPLQHLAQVPPASHGRILASPLARRLARDRGLALAAITGSGPGGRVVERDVKRATETQPQDTTTLAMVAHVPVRDTRGPAHAAESDNHEEVPLSGMRAAIAARVQQAKQTVPHFYLKSTVELDALAALRTAIQADTAIKLSLNDFFVKALALALQRVPEANMLWAGDRLLKPRGCDVAVVVAIEGGLYTPVLRGVERKSVSQISKEVQELAERARERRLHAQECQGGTSAVSNLGMYGVQEFCAIVNPPQSSVLAVGSGERRVGVKNGAPSVVSALTATLSCDHRVIDGATGARLLGAFRELIEKPMSLLV